MSPLAVVLLLVLVLLIGAALVLRAAAGGRAAAATGGRAAAAPGARSPHLIVDTLNLAHWLHAPKKGHAPVLTLALIVETIDRTAPLLLQHHPAGRVLYVLKDRESRFIDAEARDAYKQAADRNRVTISVAERYLDPPAGPPPDAAAHSSRGRDDFYEAILAARYKCPVLTADRFHDFAKFREKIPPFHVVEYSYWRTAPFRDFIRPDAQAYARLRKPRTIHPMVYFGDIL